MKIHGGAGVEFRESVQENRVKVGKRLKRHNHIVKDLGLLTKRLKKLYFFQYLHQVCYLCFWFIWRP